MFVLPKFFMIAEDMNVVMPSLLIGLMRHAAWFQAGVILLCVVVDGFVLLYVAGPHVSRWLRRRGMAWFDAVTWRLPWRRRRFQRDFVAMLAQLLDDGMAEAEAMRLAGRSVPHVRVQAGAEQAVRSLEQGQSLAGVLRHLDASGELAWRLKNASMGRQGFRDALEGWLEALDARAYQQEQLAMQFVTTGLVLFNGVLVGVLVVGVFQPLIAVIDTAALW